MKKFLIVSLFSIIFYFNCKNTIICAPPKINHFAEEKIGEYIYSRQNSINPIDAKIAFEEYLYNLRISNIKYSLSKYYEHSNFNFNIRSNLSHPNLFLGEFNNVLANHPFSHNKFNKNYELIGNKDLLGLNRPQFMSSKVMFYNKEELLNYSLNKYKNNYSDISNSSIIKDIELHKPFTKVYQKNFKENLSTYKNIINSSYNIFKK